MPREGGRRVLWISSDRDNFRIFLDRKILAGIFLGIPNVILFNVFWKILWLEIGHRTFWGLKFGQGIF